LSKIDYIIDEWMDTSSKLSSLIAELPLAKKQNEIDINMAMKKFIKKFGRFYRLRFLTLNGEVIVEEPLPPTQIPRLYGEHIIKIKKFPRESMSRVYRDKRFSRPTFTIFKPGFNEKKELSYILAADMNLSELYRAILYSLPRRGISVMIGDRDGTVIFDGSNQKLYDIVSKTDGRLVDKCYPSMRTVECDKNSYIFMGKSNYSTKWKIFLVENEKMAFYQINRSMRFIVSLIIISSFLVLMVSFWVSSRMTNSLNILSEATEKIAANNYDIELNIDTNDEIGELANSFVYMAGELKKNRLEIEKLNKELEAKVEERTRELINNQKTLDALLSSMVDDVLMVNKEGVIIYCNQNFIKKFGDKKGKQRKSVCATKHCEMIKLLEDVRKSKSVQRKIIECKCGKMTYLDVIVTPIFDNDSNFIGTLEVMRDVTDRVLKDREVRELKDYY